MSARGIPGSCRYASCFDDSFFLLLLVLHVECLECQDRQMWFKGRCLAISCIFEAEFGYQLVFQWFLGPFPAASRPERAEETVERSVGNLISFNKSTRKPEAALKPHLAAFTVASGVLCIAMISELHTRRIFREATLGRMPRPQTWHAPS